MLMKKLYVVCEVVVKFLNKSVVDQVALRQGLTAVLLFLLLLLLLLFSVFPPTLGIFLHVEADDIGERQTRRQTDISHSCFRKVNTVHIVVRG